VKAVVARTPGDAAVLELVELPVPEPAPGEVRIRVRTSAVNRADILQRQGRYPVPPGAGPVLGLEAAGTIDAIADGVSGWAIGDRAMALLTDGGYAEYVAVPAGQVLPIPPNLDWILAAAVPEVFLTAWQALGRQTPVAAGDWVLVHAGASGVGKAALQIARELGARTIATTRSPDKAEQLTDLADHALVPAGADFADRVTELTAGHGADVIIDLVGASYWAENVRALAADGAIALIGLVGGARTDLDLGMLLARRATIVASTLRARSVDQKSELVASFREWGLPRLADGRLRPVVHDMVPLTRVADAHREVERDESVGKVVLAISADGLIEM
jgi:putative PIG3 family NAD(P)H quinone oxidoreductase